MKQSGFSLIQVVLVIVLISLTVGAIHTSIKWIETIELRTATRQVEEALTYVRQAAVKTGKQYNVYCFSDRVLVRQGVQKPIYTIYLGKGMTIPDGITGKYLIFRGSMASPKTGTITIRHESRGQQADITVYIATGKIAVKYKAL